MHVSSSKLINDTKTDISTHYTTNSISLYHLINILFFSLGALIHVYSYGSLSPVIIVAVFYVIASLFLSFSNIPERRIFNRVFSVNFFMAGIAAIYANQFRDAGQLLSDPANLFDIATRQSIHLSLVELQRVSEGALAIIIWRTIYDFFNAIGFEKAPYIGIITNVLVVALSGVFSIKIARQIFGNNDYYFNRLILLFSSCGLFWLFASIHLRDSFILLAVTILTYAWLYFLVKPDFGRRLLQVILWSVIASISFGFLRQEFVFIPFTMIIAAFAALFVGHIERQRKFIISSLILIGSIIIILLTINFSTEIITFLDRGKTSYDELANTTHKSNSLGMALIVNQSIPIRLILGSIYLFIFPIPFWSGFQTESVYHLFKSTHVIFFYFILPLLIITLHQLWQHKSLRVPSLMFIVFLSLGLSTVIAGTSLETRHLGVFFPSILILATIPDLRIPTYRQKYNLYLYIILTGVFIIHMIWIILKVL